MSMARLVVCLLVFSVSVSQSVSLGGCDLREGILSCRQAATQDIIRNLRETDTNDIDVIDIFHCNMTWISKDVFAGFLSIKEV